MATIAELAVSFTAITGGLDAGVAKASQALQRFKSESEKASYAVDKEFGKLNQVFSSIGINGTALAGSISKIGLAMAGIGAGVSVGVLVSKFNESAAAAANLQDMSEKTGASIEKLSGISQIAKIQGTDMEVVASGMSKLAVNMEASGGASKKVSDALGRIGLSLKDLKGMDTGTMFESISRKMSEYGDSAGKTAVSVALFGKKGAELIPTMNLLGESGDLVVKTTEKQAVAADAYQKNLARLTIAKDSLYKSISMEVLPVANAFVLALIKLGNEADSAKTAVNGLAEDGTIKTWAKNAALYVAQLVDTFQELKNVGTYFSALKSYVSVAADPGNTKADAEVAWQRFRTIQAEIKSNKLFSQTLQDQFSVLDKATPDSPPKKTLTGGNTGSVANSAGDSFITSLKDRLTKGVSGEYAQLLQQAEEKGVKNQASALIEQIRALDESVSLKNYTNSLELATGEYRNQISQIGMTKEQIELMNVDHKMTVDLQKQIEQIERSKGALTAETRAAMEAQKDSAVETIQSLIRVRQESENSFGGGATRAINTYMETAGNVGKQVESTFTNAFRSMEDAMVQFATSGKLSFNSFANSVVADIMRIYVRMAITGLIGKIGGIWASGSTTSSTDGTRLETGGAASNYQASGGAWISGVQRFASGGVFNSPHLFPMANGGTGMLGEAGPEAVMPLTRGNDGKLGVKAAGTGSVVQVNIVNNASADGYQATAAQSSDDNGKDIITVIIDKVKGAMNQDIRNNGSFSQLLANKYGLRGSM